MNYHEIFQNLPIIGRFSIIFSLIVILPKIAERMKLPGVVGLICGGIIMGPDLLGLVNPQGTTFKLFNELGKLLLMFFAGFEINLHDFKQAGKKASTFGFLTFAVPMLVGTMVGYFLGFGWNGAILIGSLMASHTLLGLPVIKELGLIRSQAVIVTVGATIFTDISSMLVLAVCLSIHVTGFSDASQRHRPIAAVLDAIRYANGARSKLPYAGDRHARLYAQLVTAAESESSVA